MNLRRRGISVAASLALLLCLAVLLALKNAGNWLVVEDPLLPARAAVILGGHVPFSAMEAAELYKKGLVNEVWITQGVPNEEDREIARLGIDKPPSHFYSLKVLERFGLPPHAIRVLDKPALNTAEELRTIACALRANGAERVVLITSKYHTRRVKVLWRVLAGSHLDAVVRYAPDDPFEPHRWWRTTEDAMSVSREWGGLLNAWAGFPMKSAR